MQGTFSPGWFRSVAEGFVRARRSSNGRHGKRAMRLEPLELRVMLAATLTGAIDETGEKDFYTFSVAQDARYYFDSLTNDSTLHWSLDGPSGNIVNNRSFTGSDSFDIANPVLELPAGNYTVAIDGVGDDANTPYAFRLFDLKSAVNVTPGTPVSA